MFASILEFTQDATATQIVTPLRKNTPHATRLDDLTKVCGRGQWLGNSGFLCATDSEGTVLYLSSTCEPGTPTDMYADQNKLHRTSGDPRHNAVQSVALDAIQIVERNSLIVTRPDLFAPQALDAETLKEATQREIGELLRAYPADNQDLIAALTIGFIAEQVNKIDKHSSFKPREDLYPAYTRHPTKELEPETSKTEAVIDSLALPAVESLPAESSSTNIETCEVIRGTESESSSAAPQWRPPMPTFRMDGRIALIEIPWCTLGSSEELELFAKCGLTSIATCKEQGAVAWIIDLRCNSGGNMYPMLAAVWPLLDSANPGSFSDPRTLEVEPNKATEQWSANLFGMYGKIIQDANIEPIKAPVAVWTSQMTASSGEITLIAFKGRPLTRVFGSRTAGVPTANKPYPIHFQDKLLGELNLCTATCKDRAGNEYFTLLAPDIELDVPLPDFTKPWNEQEQQFKSEWEVSTNALLTSTKSWFGDLRVEVQGL